MKTYRLTRSPLPQKALGSVVAIGNFDGIHLGHQHLISQAAKIAHETNKPLGILTFKPHPRAFFRKTDAPFRLTPFPTKAKKLESLGVDYLFLQRFNAELASKTAAQFAKEILVDQLNISHAITGQDFCFGKGREGNIETLTSLGKEHGFKVSPATLLKHEEDTLSSSRIRDYIREGCIDKANMLLGTPWQISGHVVHAEKRGRLLGFPTANIRLTNFLRPKFGVYVIYAEIAGKKVFGVANIGLRPTIGDNHEYLEAHFFDFDGDLYAQRLYISLLDFIRPEKKFEDFDALKAQISKDIEVAKLKIQNL